MPQVPENFGTEGVNKMLKLIAVIIVLIGVIFIYDARNLSEKWFGFGDQNQATAGLKILGFIFAIIGGLIW